LVDILATVAGIASTGDAEILSERDWDRVMAVNLKGVFLCCQAVIPSMRAARYGRIVTIGSVLAKNGGQSASMDRSERAGTVG
jgi:3-oxoacyl-[acyl-carrier protein] reductase